MDTQEQKFPATEELVNQLLEKIRPELTRIVEQSLSGEKIEFPQPKAQIQEAVPEIEADEKPVEHIESAEFTALKAKLVAIDNSMGDLLAKLDELDEKDKLIDRLHNELQGYKAGLRRGILMPLLKEVMRCHDNITEQYKWYENELEKPDADFVKLFPQLLKEYKNLSNWLKDLLYPYDIEIVEPNAGEEFNPLKHKRYRNIPTNDAEKDKKIESCFSAGFRDTEKDRSLKLPEVNVFQLTINN